MTDLPAGHFWLVGADRAARLRAYAELSVPPALSIVDAHRRLRGPYTLAGQLVRQLVPRVQTSRPDLIRSHDIEILSVAPELRDTVPARRESLTSLAVPKERTRFYSRLRTLRLAHGLVELIRDSLDAAPQALYIENADHADPTDQEFLSVLLRRIEPARLTLVVGTTGRRLPDPLAGALRRHATTVSVAPADDAAGEATGDPTGPDADEAELARRYVWSDGVTDEPRLARAYGALAADQRARLHDERAGELDAVPDFSLRLGAIPYHRERGSDPAGAGAAALRVAVDHCIDRGFYDATVDFAVRGRAVVDWADQLDLYWVFTTKMTTSLAALDRGAESEELYDEARATFSEPYIHLQAAYATAMLYTRHFTAERKDHRKARSWINTAIAIAQLLPDRQDRAFQTVFNQNGLVLIEVHRGDLPAALRLVSAGLEHLDRELGADRHQLHRSVLRHNRAQVHLALGDLDSALADFDAVIDADPNYSEYHLERANLLRRLDRYADALADYDAAIATSPPYPEPYYNRGDLLAELGEVDRALADFGYVLELDPDHVDARINRAGLLLAGGDAAGARPDVAAAGELAPGDPHVHCLRGRLADHDGDLALAEQEYTAAIAADGELAEAWAGRAVVRHARGDHRAALADLDRAVALAPDPATYYNRGIARQAVGDWAGAVDDFTAGLHLAGDDRDLLYQRGRSYLRCGRADLGHADLARARALDTTDPGTTDPETTAEPLAGVGAAGPQGQP